MVSIVHQDCHGRNRHPLGTLRAGTVEIADVHRTRLDCDRALYGGHLASVIEHCEDDSKRPRRAIGVLCNGGAI